MGSTGQKCLLEALEAVCNVDVDSVDPRVAKALPFKAHNRNLPPVAFLWLSELTFYSETSNQVICANTMLLPEYKGLLTDKVKQFAQQGWEEVFNRVVSDIVPAYEERGPLTYMRVIDGPALRRQH